MGIDVYCPNVSWNVDFYTFMRNLIIEVGFSESDAQYILHYTSPAANLECVLSCKKENLMQHNSIFL